MFSKINTNCTRNVGEGITDEILELVLEEWVGVGRIGRKAF